MDAKELSQKLMDLTHEYYGEDKELILKQYRLPEYFKKFPATKYRKAIKTALNIASKVYLRGGTEKELRSALKYYLVCLNAEELNLDYLLCAKEIDIRSLSLKYGGSGID